MRRIISIILFCMMGAGVVLAEPSRDEVEQLAKAQELIESGQHDAAAKSISQLLVKQPQWAAAYRLLGHAHWGAGRHDQARDALTRALTLGAFSTDVLGRLAQIDQEVGNKLSLPGTLQLLMLLEPHDMSWQLYYAQTLQQQGQYDAARGVYEHVLERAPANISAMVQLAQLAMHDDQPQRAAALLETAYHLGSDHPGVVLQLAEIYRQLDQPAQALAWLERALAVAKEPSQDLVRARVMLLVQLEQFDQAAAVASHEAEQASGQDKAGWLELLGRIAHQQGQTAQALSYFAQASKISSSVSTDVAMILGTRHFQNKRYGEAVPYLTQRLAAGMDRAVLAQLVHCLIKTEQPQAAQAQLQRYVAHFGLDDHAQSLATSLFALMR